MGAPQAPQPVVEAQRTQIDPRSIWIHILVHRRDSSPDNVIRHLRYRNELIHPFGICLPKKRSIDLAGKRGFGTQTHGLRQHTLHGNPEDLFPYAPWKWRERQTVIEQTQVQQRMPVLEGQPGRAGIITIKEIR